MLVLVLALGCWCWCAGAGAGTGHLEEVLDIPLGAAALTLAALVAPRHEVQQSSPQRGARLRRRAAAAVDVGHGARAPRHVSAACCRVARAEEAVARPRELRVACKHEAGVDFQASSPPAVPPPSRPLFGSSW